MRIPIAQPSVAKTPDSPDYSSHSTPRQEDSSRRPPCPGWHLNSSAILIWKPISTSLSNGPNGNWCEMRRCGPLASNFPSSPNYLVYLDWTASRRQDLSRNTQIIGQVSANRRVTNTGTTGGKEREGGHSSEKMLAVSRGGPCPQPKVVGPVARDRLAARLPQPVAGDGASSCWESA